MIQALRDYQQEIYLSARQALSKYKAICINLATGAGKTPVASAMVSSVFEKHKLAWFITPRRELVSQASTHFTKWSVPHNIINAASHESRAYNIHVVSKETLIRRWDKIKRWPDICLIDEAHIHLDFQIELYKRAPESTKFIGFTATSERLDGRGLSKQGGGIYDILIEGPGIPELTRQGYLSPLRYFSPPIEGLADLHVKGMDYDEDELEALLERRKIYGELVGHYEKWGRGKPALIFCRSVKAAYQTAERFRDKGFNFHCIEGKMSDKKRKDLISALTKGEIDGLTNCDICTYGLDVPRVEYGASIRPTLSRALYMQMIGRILRPFVDPVTGYKKQEAFFFDHVNMILEHQDDNYPGMPLHYVPKISWNFHGTEKRKRKKDQNNIRLCPLLDFFYCNRPSCVGCKYNKDVRVQDARKPMIVVQADLKEIEKPKSLSEMPYEERREIQDRIGNCILKYRADAGEEAVAELLKIAESLGYNPMWVYHRLADENKKAINVPLLHCIVKIKGWKPGKVWFMMQELKKQGYVKQEFKEVMNA